MKHTLVLLLLAFSLAGCGTNLSTEPSTMDRSEGENEPGNTAEPTNAAAWRDTAEPGDKTELESRSEPDQAAAPDPTAISVPTVTPVLPRTDSIQEIHSSHVDDLFKIYISLPGGYDPNAEPGYHVVYVTDGDLYFDGAGDFVPKGGAVKVVNDLARQGMMPPAVVVGIGYVGDDKRDRDFHIDPDSFYAFLATELIPQIDMEFNTEPTRAGRTLIGHSWGSYFVFHAFLNHVTIDSPFFNYVAISGDLTGYDGFLFKAEEEMVERVGAGGILDAALFMTIGNLEYRDSIDSNIKMHEQLSSRNYQDFRSRYVLYSGQEHYGIVIPAIRTALSWLFEQQEQ